MTDFCAWHANEVKDSCQIYRAKIFYRDMILALKNRQRHYICIQNNLTDTEPNNVKFLADNMSIPVQ